MRWKELGRGADRRARSKPKPNIGTTKIRGWRNKEGEISAGRVEKEAEQEKSRRSSRGKEVKKKGDDRSADRK